VDFFTCIYVRPCICKGEFLVMKRLMVTYELRGKLVRAMLNLPSENAIKPLLMQYHMESDVATIKIKNIREYVIDQKVLHVWYCD